MDKTTSWLTKKKIMVGALAMMLVYVVSYFNVILGLPSLYDNFCCVDDRMFNLFFIFIPIFIFTLVNLKLNDLGFEKWKKLTFIYLIMYLIVYSISPTQANGYIWFQRETISFFGSILYSVISIILIIYESLKKD
ncbi:hypothetical protein IT399_02635 [Candidatus Nomurabacteria bacterium]|nr:hypothetical protein [Candidatus Nomurabacteria bacterium]